MNDLAFYIKCFQKLRSDNRNGGAPHKPVLLLSIIDLVEDGTIPDHKICITPELVSNFKSYWSELVKTQHNLVFALPFYHMSSEPFWKLLPNPGCEKWIESKSSMKSFSNLNTAVNHAQIDQQLFYFMSDKESCNLLRYTLLNTYFPGSDKQVGLKHKDYALQIAREITEESAEEYKRKIEELKKGLSSSTAFEEEIFVRSGLFKREVPKIYQNTCAISGLRVDATLNVSMIDACHIKPFSESYDDTISNGIALCPNLHRAFDRGLISIDEEYKVLVNPNFKEPNESTYSIRQFLGKQILLPVELRYYPSQENIQQHRQKFGFS
jgi:putative restriction endonuclease